MKLKQKNYTFTAALVGFTVILGIVIQLLLGYAEEMQSTREAKAAMQGLIRLAGTGLEEEAAQAARISASTEKAMVSKREKLEQLSLLMLVNPWNELPEGYVPELKEINENHQMDARCADALIQMMNDCKAAGAQPYICSSYRTQKKQEDLFENKIGRLINAGYDPREAPAVAALSVALPGTSEHQLGLAVDIIDENFTDLTSEQEYTATSLWLHEHCWDYGFVLRYPNGTTDITGIIYEPWHYRYVGVEAAQEIKALGGIPLEEYLQLRRGH